MNCPCGTLCIAAAYVAKRRSSKEGSRHGCRLLQPCFLSKTCAVVQALHRNLSIYTSIQMHCTTAQVEANLGLLWGKTPKVLNSTCFGADYTVRDLKIATLRETQTWGAQTSSQGLTPGQRVCKPYG